MIRNYKDYKPIRIAGQIFIFLGLFILFLAFFQLKESEEEYFFQIFAWVNICWYLFMGLGLLQQKIWGYYLLKIYLYLMAIGFPIGTYIGLNSLKYLKEKNIKEFFETKSIEL